MRCARRAGSLSGQPLARLPTREEREGEGEGEREIEGGRGREGEREGGREWRKCPPTIYPSTLFVREEEAGRDMERDRRSDIEKGCRRER